MGERKMGSCAPKKEEDKKCLGVCGEDRRRVTELSEEGFNNTDEI